MRLHQARMRGHDPDAETVGAAFSCRNVALVNVIPVAIGLTMGLYLFALVMIVLNLAAFGVDSGVPFLRRRQSVHGVFPEQLSQ